LGDHTFSSNKSSSFIFTIEQGSITTIGDAAFSNNVSLTSLQIPDTVNQIENDAFSNNPLLISLQIPNSVSSLGQGIIRGCSQLPSFTVPSSVSTIGNGTFSGLTSATTIYIPKEVTTFGGEVCGLGEDDRCTVVIDAVNNYRTTSKSGDE
jgi:hypothetical protein